MRRKKAGIVEYLGSFINGRLVEKVTSSLNGDLYVYYINGRYSLEAVDTNYSFGDLHDGFRKIFKKIGIREFQPASVLLLGLAGGSVPVILLDELKIDCDIQAVDFDPEVLYLANKYFNLGHHDRLKVAVKDAEEFVSTCNNTYDLIVFDIYINDQIPPQLEEAEFLRHLKRLLTPDGRLLYNKDVNHPDMKKSLPVLEERLRKVFPEIEKLQVVKNNYFFWGR